MPPCGLCSFTDFVFLAWRAVDDFSHMAARSGAVLAFQLSLNMTLITGRKGEVVDSPPVPW